MGKAEIEVLAVSGSLRKHSINTMFLRFCSEVVSTREKVIVFEELGHLPLFNPDIEHEAIESVQRWRMALRHSDAVMIASPEYAHGVTGIIKNALDWVVGSTEFDGKPTVLLNLSMRAIHAHSALQRTLEVMNAQMVSTQTIGLPSQITSDDLQGSIELKQKARGIISTISEYCDVIKRGEQ